MSVFYSCSVNHADFFYTNKMGAVKPKNYINYGNGKTWILGFCQNRNRSSRKTVQFCFPAQFLQVYAHVLGEEL